MSFEAFQTQLDSFGMPVAENNPAIQVKNLGKCYHVYNNPRDRFFQMLPFRKKQYFTEFWALKDVSFEANKGETLGIIGRNGSGKSTLLQLICGTLNPTSGQIYTRGRIAALLELGAGFNPEFTGRENIFMNAAILGLSQEETRNRYEDIVAFADIGEFIEQPVKTYSSGMIVRLAFAVQAQVEPDIFVVDEALSVGDAKFQAKCFGRLKNLKDRGTSILLVSHNSEQIVTHCSRALLLENGRIFEKGNPRFVVNRYMDLLFGKDKPTHSSSASPSNQSFSDADSPRSSLSLSADIFATRPGYNHYEYRWGDNSASILDFSLSADGREYPSSIDAGQKIVLNVALIFFKDIIRPIFGITIKTKEGVTVYGANSETLEVKSFKTLGRCGQTVLVTSSFICRLAPGDYFISLGIATKQGDNITPHDRRYDAIHFHVRPNSAFFGLADLGIKLTASELES